MKIICKSNYDLEYVDDSLVCDNVNLYHGLKLEEFLNEKLGGTHSPDFYMLVEDDYILYKFEI